MFLFFLLMHLVKTEEGNLVKCPVGYEISFECPCCPEEFDECRFKKLFQGGYILRDGVLVQPSKYKLDDHKTHITLKECNEDDEGTYVWMCGKCNINKQFHLEVATWLWTRESLRCIVGDEFSFECPCCSDEFEDCRFQKHGGDGYIMRRGVLNSNTKYSLNMTHVTLNKCAEIDEGNYVWTCGKCRNKHFYLKVHLPEISAVVSHSPKKVPWIPIIFHISLKTLAMIL